MTYDEREAEFLKELTALTKKHKIQIGGCGCCDSPWLMCIEDFEARWPYKSTDIEEYNYSYESYLVFAPNE